MNSRQLRQPNRRRGNDVPLRWLRAACTSAALLYAVLPSAPTLWAQPPLANAPTTSGFKPGPKFGGKRPNWRSPDRELTPEIKKKLDALPAKERMGIERLRRMVTDGMTHAFIAREVTFQANGSQREQWVRWDPNRGMRRESIATGDKRSPGAGEIFLDDFAKSYMFKPKDGKWYWRETILARPQGRIRDVLKKLYKGELKATLEGQDTVAGRTADIVQLGPPEGTPGVISRFWIDRATGMRLKNEIVGPEGRLLGGSYYLSMDLTPRFGPDDFTAPANALPAPSRKKQTFHTIEEARRAGVNPPMPGYMPVGFTLRLIEVMEGEKDNKETRLITLRYGNGLTAISLVIGSAKMGPPKAQENAGADKGSFATDPRGGPDRVYVWRDSTAGYMLFSNQSDDEMRRIAESVR